LPVKEDINSIGILSIKPKKQVKMKTMSEFIIELKESGFKVYTSDKKENPSYIHFVKDDKIGYCQNSDFGMWSFSTVHKPCRECGTGFNVVDRIEYPTIKLAESCLVNIPQWAAHDRKYSNGVVKKYKDWNDYIIQPINQILKQIEL
jgi:hypothetical protein